MPSTASAPGRYLCAPNRLVNEYIFEYQTYAVGMAFAWIELDHEQSGWGSTRVLVAKLSRDGYVVQVLIGPEPKVLIVTGKRLTPARLTAIGRPAPPRETAG